MLASLCRPRAARVLPSSLSSARLMSTSDKFSRPMPHPLPPAQQREFEELIRAASESPAAHPDTPRPVQATFDGDVNPSTGERNGPKREPVQQRWSEDEPEWSLKGRISDF